MLRNFKNEIDFWLRRHLKWSLRNASKKIETLTTPNQVTPESKTLIQQYPEMQKYAAYLPEYQWLENLNLLSLLNQVSTEINIPPPPIISEPVRVLEVGMKNWSTLPALTSFLKLKTERPVSITGIELDLWRVYTNGKSRFDELQDNIALVKHVASDNVEINWLEGDVCELDEKPFDIVCCFLPFVFENPHLLWGLPRRYFNPNVFFQKLSQLVSPEGYLVLCNQGEAEFNEQKKLLEHLDFKIKKSGLVSQPFLDLKHQRYAWVLHKTTQPVKSR